MNARLSRDMEAEDFVTVILAEFAPGEVRIVNCGHHPPVKLAVGAGELQVMAPEEFAPPPGLEAAVKRVVRLLLEHARGGPAGGVLLVLGEPRPGAQPDPLADPLADVI
jgi:hypothetical protein